MSSLVNKKLGLILLAAGQSNRFQGNKLIQPITAIDQNGKPVSQPLLLHGLDKLNALSNYLQSLNIASEVIIVLGLHQTQLQDLLPKSAQVVINQNSSQGLSTSIKTAVKASYRIGASDMLLTLGDHIGVSIDNYQQLINLWVQSDLNTCSFYQNQLAAPAVFNRKYFNDLTALQGDQGAKPLLKKLQKINQLSSLTLPNGIYDIDTKADLLAWQQQFQPNW